MDRATLPRIYWRSTFGDVRVYGMIRIFRTMFFSLSQNFNHFRKNLAALHGDFWSMHICS